MSNDTLKIEQIAQILQESLNKLKTYNFQQYIKEGTYLDVYDDKNCWRLGLIQQIINDDKLKINFDGWSSQWDEIHKMSQNQKLAPLRQYTQGYSGSKNSHRQFQFQNKSDLNRMLNGIQLMEETVKSGVFISGDIHFFNQQYRGEIYILVDSILCHNSELPPRELKLALEFFSSFIRFFIKYIDNLPKYLVHYIEGKSINNLLYLTNQEIAICAAHHEIFESISKIFQLDGDRTCKFYYQNELVLETQQTNYVLKPKDKYSTQHNQIVNFINQFGQLGGFDKLLTLVRWEQPLSNDQIYKIPLNILRSILQILRPVIPLMSSIFRENFLPKLRESTLQRLNNISEKEFKDIDLHQAYSLIRSLSSTFKDFNEIAEEVEINFTIKLVMSPYLERKIKGMNELKDFINRADGSYKSVYNSSKQIFSVFKSQKLQDYFKQHKLMEYLLLNYHSEVFKRSVGTLIFMSQQFNEGDSEVSNNGFTDDQLNLLWNTTSNKHEADLRVIYEVLVEIAKQIPLNNLEFLYKKIYLIPIEKYDDITISLIRDFSINAMASLAQNYQSSQYFFFQKKEKRATNSKEFEYFGLKHFQNIIQDSSKLNPQLIFPAIQAISLLLKNQNFHSEREKILQFCFENIKTGNSVPQSLFLSKNILLTFKTNGMFQKDNLDELVNKLSKEYNIIQLVVDSFEEYLKKINKIQNAGKNTIFGKLDHLQNISIRLDFIEFINHYLRKAEVKIDHLKKLWTLLIKESVNVIEKNTFLDFLIRKKDPKNPQKKNVSFILSEALMKEMFDEIFFDSNLMNDYNIDLQIYQCIQQIFMNLNQKLENLDINNKQLIKINKFETIIGKQFFWNILIKCKNQQVVTRATNLLVNLHLRVTQVNYALKQKMYESFLFDCLLLLQQQDQTIGVKENIISCLKIFLYEIEGKDEFQAPNINQIQLQVQLNKDKIQNQPQKDPSSKLIILSLKSNNSLLFLRKMINQEFNLQNFDFEMFIPSEQFRIPPETEEDYSVQAIENIKQKDQVDIIIQLQKTKNQNFELIQKFQLHLSNQSKIMEILFQLLSHQNNEVLKDNIWEILKILPTNKQSKQQVYTLSVEGTEMNWNSLFSQTNYRKLLYYLNIIDEILSSDKAFAWVQDILRKKGIIHLLKIYMNIKNTDFDLIFNLRCIGQLSKILSIFIKNFFGTSKQFFDKVFENKNIQKDQETLIFCQNLLLKSLNNIQIVLGNHTLLISQTTQNDIGEYFGDFFKFSFSLIQSLLNITPSLFQDFCEQKNLKTIIFEGMLNMTVAQARTQIALSLLEILQIKTTNYDPQFIILHIIIDNFLDIKMLENYRENCNELFQLLQKLLSSPSSQSQKINFEKVTNNLVFSIKQLKTYEKNVFDKDFLLQGCMNILELLMSTNQTLETLVASDQDLQNILLNDCLFEMDQNFFSDQKNEFPKCKNPETRKSTFNLLMYITKFTGPSAEITTDYLKKLLQKADWRTKYFGDWQILAFPSKSKTGYVGLKNLGCTCYMNSLFQQFFMIKDFSEALMAIEGQVPDLEPAENIVYQSQLIFGALKFSQKQYHDPRNFCQAFKDIDGKPIDVVQQMDADEFFNTYLDRLETLLKQSNNDFIIKRTFGGVFANELICKGCPHTSETDEPYLAIPLIVKNKKSVSESLSAYIEGEMLDGDNMYLCDKCDKKVPTLKRQSIKKLPNIMLIVLKRFEFDFETMSKNKVNDYCEFPLKIDMTQYTQGYLKKKDQDEKETDLEEEEDTEEAAKLFPEDYYQYNLRGVVIHQGTTDSGHYYSFINDSQKQTWIELNDINVRQFNIQDLQNLAFGGEEKQGDDPEQQGFGKGTREKNRNAYLLFYERQSIYDENGNKIEKMIDLNELKKTNKKDTLIEELQNDNIKFHLNKNIFSNEYLDFQQELLGFVKTRTDQQAQQIFKQACIFFLTVVVRASEREQRLPTFLKDLRQVIQDNQELAEWFVKNFCDEDLIIELLVDCPVHDMKYLISGLLYTAIMKVSDNDALLDYKQFEQSSPNVQLMNIFIYILEEGKYQFKILSSFYRVFSFFTKSSQNAKQYLLNQKAIGRIALYISEQIQQGTGYKDIKEYKTIGRQTSELVNGINKDRTLKDNEIKSIQEIYESRIEQRRIENITVNLTHVHSSLSILVRSIRVFKDVDQKTPHALPQISYQIEADELEFLKSPELWQRLLSRSITKLSNQELAKFFAYICYQNSKITSDLLDIIDVMIYENDSSELKVYFVTMIYQLNIQDQYHEDRVKKISKILLQYISQTFMFFVSTEMAIDCLFKLCAMDKKMQQLIAQIINDNKQYQKLFVGWIQESAMPHIQIQQKKWSIYKNQKKMVQYDQQKLQNNSVQKFQNRMQERNTRLRKILKLEEFTIDYDSDEDQSDKQPQVGDYLDYKVDGTYIVVQVTDNIQEMFKVKAVDDQFYHKWIFYDDDNIAPPNTARLYYKNKLEFYSK